MNLEKISAIAIGGDAGTGKTATSLLLAKILGWQSYSAGNDFRAERAGYNDSELGAQSGTSEEHDLIDNAIAQYLSAGEYVVEGRVAAVVAKVQNIPGVLKVMTVVGDDNLRFERIYQRNKKQYKSVADAREKTLRREEENKQIFEQRYRGISYLDQSNYDVVIDTGDNSLARVVALIFAELS